MSLRDAVRPVWVLYAALVALYVLFRIGSFTNIGDRVTDTTSYEHVARRALWDGGFWTGERGFTVPLFYKIFVGTESRIVAQLVFSTIAWIVLAFAIARCVRHRRLQPPAFAVVLAFSLTTEVILWDTLLLSESLTFALTALLLAAWLELFRSPRFLWVALVLSLSLLWAFARDTNSYLVLFFGVLAALALVWGRRRGLKIALAIGCIAIFALDYGSAEIGKRWLQPMQNVVQVRVLPNESLRRYFIARGLDPQSNWPVGDWMRQRSRGVYLDYLLSHPRYTLAQPFHGRQQALYSTADNAASLIDPNLRIYNDNANRRFLPLPAFLGRLLFVRGVALVCALMVALLLGVLLVWRLLGAPTVWLAPLAVLASTYPHFLVVWHQSGYEVDRHALEASLLLRLSLLLLAILAIDRALSQPAARRGRR